jgi:alpha-beta hydrolase superfamily lysophospholipase
MTEASAAAPRRTFVLVHGTSHGGWAWRRVADRLQARGHKVYTPTLTGLADRSHLMSAAISLDTHIFDVVNLIKWEGLEDVCLVGHSSGGAVVSGAIEHVLPEVSSIVFLDAFLPENGQKGLDWNSPHARAAIEAAVKAGAVSRPAGLELSVQRQREGSRLARRPGHAAADRHGAAADEAHRRARARSAQDLYSGHRLSASDLRPELCEDQS